MNPVNNFIFRFRKILTLQHGTNTRYLLSKASLGMNDYEAVREKQISKVDGDKFREKMMKVCNSSNSNSLVFTEDLKQMIHIARATEEDLSLVEKMILKQNSLLRFGSFVFGPVIMRMYHNLNKPEEALKVFKNENLSGFFDQLSSFTILIDLLFNNRMYNEVIEIYHLMRDKQLHFGKHPKSVMVLVFGAYYKFNTPEHYEQAYKLYNEMVEVGNIPLRRSLCFMAALALNQNHANICLDILATTHNQTFHLVRSIRILALCAAGYIDEAMMVLKSVLNYDRPSPVKHTFPKEVVDKLGRNVEKIGSKDLLHEYARVKKILIEQDYLSDDTLEKALCSEVVVVNKIDRNATTLNAAIDNIHVNRKDFRNFYRTGLSDMAE